MSFARRLAHRAADLLYLPGTARLWERRLQGRVLCLLYHRVDDGARYPWLARRGPPVTAPDELERDLRFWQRLGARFGTFRDLRDGWFPGAGEVGIVVCFDDGFRDNYTHGVEVLTRLGISATIFQISGIVGATALNWEHAIYHRMRDEERAARVRRRARELVPEVARATDAGASIEDALRFAAPRAGVERLLAAVEERGDRETEAGIARELYPEAEELRRAAAAGFEIGSHGADHRPRTRLDAAEFEADLAGSRARLGEILGAPPECYSYPFGRHLPGDEAICRRHYRQAAIVDPRPIERGTSPWSLPRATWPGPARNALRRRRWLLSGRI